MTNQVAALAGREPPVMMEEPLLQALGSNHWADPQAGMDAGTRGISPGQW